MPRAVVENSTVIIGPSDKTAEVALELAEAARVNAKAILAIARAIVGPEQAAGIYFGGDNNHTHTHDAAPVWRGEGFYPPEYAKPLPVEPAEG